MPIDGLWTLLPLFHPTMWMCTDGHDDENRKRWAKSRKKSHDRISHLYNKMCEQNITQ